jgi:hypothetical protein
VKTILMMADAARVDPIRNDCATRWFIVPVERRA